jgi:hypothetical protein
VITLAVSGTASFSDGFWSLILSVSPALPLCFCLPAAVSRSGGVLDQRRNFLACRIVGSSKARLGYGVSAAVHGLLSVVTKKKQVRMLTVFGESFRSRSR